MLVTRRCPTSPWDSNAAPRQRPRQHRLAREPGDIDAWDVGARAGHRSDASYAIEVVIDSSGGWWRGTEPADLDVYLAEFRAGGYP